MSYRIVLPIFLTPCIAWNTLRDPRTTLILSFASDCGAVKMTPCYGWLTDTPRDTVLLLADATAIAASVLRPAIPLRYAWARTNMRSVVHACGATHNMCT